MNLKIKYNAPTTLSFSFLCFAVFIVNTYIIPLTGSSFSIIDRFFTVPSSVAFEPANPVDYLRLFTHILGHANWTHLIANLSYILILGPMLETSYGPVNLALMILVTGFATGVVNVCFFQTPLLGASGVVFMMVLLSSFTNHKKNEIPLTFILVVILFLGREIVNAFGNDDISQFAHLAGGLCGSLFGFFAQAGQTTKTKRAAAKRAVQNPGPQAEAKAAGAKAKGAAYNPGGYSYRPAFYRQNTDRAVREYEGEPESGGSKNTSVEDTEIGGEKSVFGFADLVRGGKPKPQNPKKAAGGGFLGQFRKKTGISEVDDALSDFEESGSFKK